ncbi:MAG TPA: hypothetical protein VGM53_21155 [Streptosporangiaceae bacterium]
MAGGSIPAPMISPEPAEQPGGVTFGALKGREMLFLLGRRLHPAISLLIGAAALAAGLVVHADLLAAGGGLMVVWAGVRVVRRVRGRGTASDGGHAR